jgi:hypothetical protein
MAPPRNGQRREWQANDVDKERGANIVALLVLGNADVDDALVRWCDN